MIFTRVADVDLSFAHGMSAVGGAGIHLMSPVDTLANSVALGNLYAHDGGGSGLFGKEVCDV